MQLEEMKSMWEDMSQHMEQQKFLTDKLIKDMTKERYTNKFSKLQLFESFGAFICFASAIYLAFNFYKLDTWYLMTFGVFTLLSLIVLPIVTLRKINNIKKLNISDGSYKEVIVKYHKSKRGLIITQKFNAYLSVALAFTVLPVTSKILNNRNLFESDHINSLWIYIGILLVFLFFLTRWGIKGYKNVTNSAEIILKELDI